MSKTINFDELKTLLKKSKKRDIQKVASFLDLYTKDAKANLLESIYTELRNQYAAHLKLESPFTKCGTMHLSDSLNCVVHEILMETTWRKKIIKANYAIIDKVNDYIKEHHNNLPFHVRNFSELNFDLSSIENKIIKIRLLDENDTTLNVKIIDNKVEVV